MTKKIYAIAALIIFSLVLHIYLTSEFYAVQYGTATGESICSINDVFNCEAVAASKYSSLFGGIPNSILGFMLCLVILITLLGTVASNDDAEKNSLWVQFLGGLASLNLLASVIMGAIAFTVMDVYCLFCIALYILSILIFILTLYTFKYSPSAAVLKKLLKSQVFLSLLISIPALSFLGHQIIKNDYSPAAQEKEINAVVSSWQNKEATSFDSLEPLFILNPGAKVKVVEFADFLCPHCATAGKSIKSFLSTHKDVEFSFYSYPLDPNCNKNFKSEEKGPGFSCTLAAGVLCAQKQGKGVELHNDIFENQNYYRKVAMSENNEGLISQMESLLGEIDLLTWKTCIKSDSTNQALIDSAKLGKKANVQGTPTIYMNGKKLNGGANYLVLKAAHSKVN